MVRDNSRAPEPNLEGAIKSLQIFTNYKNVKAFWETAEGEQLDKAKLFKKPNQKNFRKQE